MKTFKIVLLLCIMSNSLFSQASGQDTTIIVKEIESYSINETIKEIAEILKSNCNNHRETEKDERINYSFITQNNDSTIVVYITPIGGNMIYTERVYGVFLIGKEYFYCIGDSIAELFNDSTVQGKRKVKFSDREKIEESFASPFIGKFSHSSTQVYSIKKIIEKKHFIFKIKPCNNLRFCERKQLRRI